LRRNKSNKSTLKTQWLISFLVIDLNVWLTVWTRQKS